MYEIEYISLSFKYVYTTIEMMYSDKTYHLVDFAGNFSICDSHLKSKRCRNPAKCAFRYLTCFSSPFIKRKCYNY